MGARRDVYGRYFMNDISMQLGYNTAETLKYNQVHLHSKEMSTVLLRSKLDALPTRTILYTLYAKAENWQPEWPSCPMQFVKPSSNTAVQLFSADTISTYRNIHKHF